ncbi:MAG: DUF5107 domain-containing protein [Anaerolineae bacterium]
MRNFQRYFGGITTALILILTACTSLGNPLQPTATHTVESSTTPTPTERTAPTLTRTTTPTPTETSSPLPDVCDYCEEKHATPEPTQTPEPPSSTATPTLSPTPSPTPLPPSDPSLALWETEITLNSYGWEQALVPSTPDQPFYPYPALNFDAVAGPTPRSYRAVVLENTYTRITVVPDLGGRILRWEDKATGRRLTYANPVIKPTHWGYRGWWLATGGIEWAFPVDEHGLNEYRPWQYLLLSGDGWRGVRLWDTDDRTGMTIEITLRLFAGRSDLSITPRLANPTGEAHPLQFWINAMLTLSGGDSPSPAIRFWVPTDTMMVHSTGDGSLPGPRGLIAWPIHNGRDFSHYSEWHHYLGLFATEARGTVGAYDGSVDQGLVRSYPPSGPQGVKIFSLGDLPADLYTDGGSRYFELWGGYNRTFFPEDYVTLEPGGVLTWEEHWYPVHGIGGLGWANNTLAASFTRAGENLVIGLYAPSPASASLVLRQGDEVKAEWAPTAGPGTPFRELYPGGGEGWILEIWQDGSLLVQMAPS